MERAETKKECPSCGLGVELNANICEFCGWDFEEEDEWILQIEKLERELLMEKQKFEPGTVNHMIESTLRNPVLERVEVAHSIEQEAESEDSEQLPVATAQELFSEEEQPVAQQELFAEEEPPEAPPRPAAPAPKVRTVRTVKPPPPAKEPEAPRQVRKVRQVASKPKPEEPVRERKTRSVRAVRRVKS